MVHILAMTKLSCRTCLIEVGETLYQLISRILCFQFCGTFITHLPPHKFRVIIKSGCEVVFHDIKCTLDLHPDQTIFQLDVANVFNSVSRGVIFQKLRVASGDIIHIIPYVRAIYAFESSLFYNHPNHEGNVTIIPFAMGTCQGDPLGRALFVLAHFRALCSITDCFSSCLFSSIMDDIHIIHPPSIISSTYEHF